MPEKKTIAQEVNAEASEKLIPLSVQVEITYRCNLGCFYCYQKEYDRSTDLPLSFWQDVFGQLADAGTLYLTITGGEPSMRADFVDIVESARRRRLAVSLISNGTLLTEPLARRFADLGVVDVGVSLLAASPQVHDRLCGAPGSFEKALNAIRALRRAGVKVLIKHTVSSENFGEYRELDRLSEHEGCLFEADTLVIPQRPGIPARFALTAEQHFTFMKEMRIKSMPVDCRSSAYLLHCDAGRSLCGITAAGIVVPCIQLPLPFGSFLNEKFSDIWIGKLAADFRKKEKSISSRCEECGLAGSCSRCHGVAFLESGRWDGPSPSLCARAKAVRQRDLVGDEG